MPRRDDLQTLLVIGSGPIVIGQACEFDYAGVQAIKALKAQGYRVVLINSNPATIMTDPELADATYVEPLTVHAVEKVIARERPQALLPTVGGQTGLNMAVALAEAGVLERYGVELIGARLDTVRIAEDRQLFAEAMRKAGLPVAQGGFARSVAEGEKILEEVGFPAILRPSFTLGGEGSGIAYNIEEFRDLLSVGLALSPVHQVLVERSVIGWKEFELEVMRDRADNAVIVCSIENLDPMGVHTGDSITVAPAMTLTDREYQRMRDWGLRVIRAVGVETGGSNVQFAVHPQTGEMLVVEMNPRVSRSSALASKATGFPIAKIAALLAVGFTLDEIPNDITRETPASFEPTLDYVVVKIPRWDFAKFPHTPPVLGTSMKSVGEVMAIGRTFKEALQKGLRSLEVGVAGLEVADKITLSEENLAGHLITPSWDRIFYLRMALRRGMSVEEIADHTHIDPWFLEQLSELVTLERTIDAHAGGALPRELLMQAKRWGFSDAQLGRLLGVDEADLREQRRKQGLRPVYSRVDTCAAEFQAHTPYLYSTWGSRESESAPTSRRKVLILGGGPIRIGQGIEFDCCCSHAAFALKELGVEALMMNCNPETVSTDYDTADRLYFDPLTLEDVLHLMEEERPEGVIVQFGGQTPLKLARRLEAAGVPILGTSPDAIDLAEDRERFGALLSRLGIPQPPGGSARTEEEAVAVARRLGYPVLLRPSYVLGGRAMVLAHDEMELRRYLRQASAASDDHGVLIDHFLDNAIEIDVDAVSDGATTVIAGILQHVEPAGVHSGDSTAVLPPWSLTPSQLTTLRDHTRHLAAALGVRGLMNVQYALKDGVIYVLEVNPRASRTVPFISKATGVRWAAVATRVMAGVSLREQGVEEVALKRTFVKMVVLPWGRFPLEDTLLGPEMKSTGEVLGMDLDLGAALAKAQLGTGTRLPTRGAALLSVHDKDKAALLPIARDLVEMGFALLATTGTAAALRAAGLSAERVYKVGEGRLDVVDRIKNGDVQLIINTPRVGRATAPAELALRQAATRHKVPTVTTMEGARALSWAIAAMRRGELGVESLQEVHTGRSGVGVSL